MYLNIDICNVNAWVILTQYIEQVTITQILAVVVVVAVLHNQFGIRILCYFFVLLLHQRMLMLLLHLRVLLFQRGYCCCSSECWCCCCICVHCCRICAYCCWIVDTAVAADAAFAPAEVYVVSVYTAVASAYTTAVAPADADTTVHLRRLQLHWGYCCCSSGCGFCTCRSLFCCCTWEYCCCTREYCCCTCTCVYCFCTWEHCCYTSKYCSYGTVHNQNNNFGLHHRRKLLPQLGMFLQRIYTASVHSCGCFAQLTTERETLLRHTRIVVVYFYY